jgi:hypothetical protein
MSKRVVRVPVDVFAGRHRAVAFLPGIECCSALLLPKQSVKFSSQVR